MMKVQNKVKLTWRRDSGDHEYTEDIYLYINGKPTEICISGATQGEFGILYNGNEQLGIGDTRKELKDMLFNDYPEIVEEAIQEYTK